MGTKREGAEWGYADGRRERRRGGWRRERGERNPRGECHGGQLKGLDQASGMELLLFFAIAQA